MYYNLDDCTFNTIIHIWLAIPEKIKTGSGWRILKKKGVLDGGVDIE